MFHVQKNKHKRFKNKQEPTKKSQGNQALDIKIHSETHWKLALERLAYRVRRAFKVVMDEPRVREPASKCLR